MSQNFSTNLTRVALAVSLLWAVTIPLWHFPDEQAHFAQVQNYAELGHDPTGQKDLSAEIYFAEEKLSTLRDERGNNSYTYNRSYNIVYAPSTEGFHEKIINSQPSQTRTTYLKQESPHYPPAFYALSAIGYRMSYNQSLITRVFMTRIVSVLLFIGIIWATYKFAQELFPHYVELQISTSLLVLLHPMLVFTSSGINNDTLITLISTLVFWLSLRLIRTGISLRRLLALGVVFGIGIVTKQTAYLLLPYLSVSLLAALVLQLVQAKKIMSKRRRKFLSVKLLLSFGVISLIIAALFKAIAFFNQGFWLPYWPAISPLEIIHHPDFAKQAIALAGRFYRETFVWYWGVYRWLSLTLPMNVYRLIKVAIIMSGSGWLAYFYYKVKLIKAGKRWWTKLDTRWLVLIIGNFAYSLILLTWELSGILQLGFGHGLQGRYFFPFISLHMAFMAFGWWQLTPASVRRYLPLAVLGACLIFNLYSLVYVLDSYYDTSNLNNFTNQLSQYKPMLAKWPYVILYPILLGICVINLVYRLIQFKPSAVKITKSV